MPKDGRILSSGKVAIPPEAGGRWPVIAEVTLQGKWRGYKGKAHLADGEQVESCLPMNSLPEVRVNVSPTKMQAISIQRHAGKDSKSEIYGRPFRLYRRIWRSLPRQINCEDVIAQLAEASYLVLIEKLRSSLPAPVVDR